MAYSESQITTWTDSTVVLGTTLQADLAQLYANFPFLAKLAGRSGGQTLVGGTGTGENLKLTSNTTKDGLIQLGDNNHVDESDDSLNLSGGIVMTAGFSGTWTPVLGGAGGTSGQTYSANNGEYVKIGDLAFCSFRLVLTAKGTITGNLQLQGLPFTVLNSSGGYSGLTVGYMSVLTLTAAHWLIGYATINSTNVLLFEVDSTGAAPVALTTTNVANTTTLIGTVIYKV